MEEIGRVLGELLDFSSIYTSSRKTQCKKDTIIVI